MDQRALILLNMQFMYALLSRAFCEEPDETLLDVLEGDHVAAEVELVQDEYSDQLIMQLSKIREAVHACGSGEARSTMPLRMEYTKIFIGPETLHATPWESMHRNHKNVLFQPEVLEVREAYRAAGLLPARYPAVSDDFIGLELDFMNKLAAEAYTSFEGEKLEESVTRLRQSLDFLNNHLLQWIDLFARSVTQHYGNCFYAWLADFTATYLKRDKDLLEDLLAK